MRGETGERDESKTPRLPSHGSLGSLTSPSRKRIQRLLALTQPVVGDITFIQEGSEDAGSALAEQYQVALNNAENEMSKKHSNGILSAQAVASRLQARNEVRENAWK